MKFFLLLKIFLFLLFLFPNFANGDRRNLHEKVIENFAVYRDKLVSTSEDGTTKIWNLKTGELIKTTRGNIYNFIQDDKLVLGSRNLKIVSPHSGEVIKKLNVSNKAWSNSVIFFDEKLIAEFKEDFDKAQTEENSEKLKKNIKSALDLF